MNRRNFLKLLSTGIIGYELDLDKLLWVPGQKTIFVMPETPRVILSASDIVAIELERILPRLSRIFEEDDKFYGMFNLK